MKKIILLGAFDRYNYGDNLMPILFELYAKKYMPEIFLNYVFEYAAISDSNLKKYNCLSTKNINSYTNEDFEALVVIGGEVLCAKNADLYLHMQDSQLEHNVLRILKKVFRGLFSYYSDPKYSAKWEYPYIPSSRFFKSSPKVIFNTVGGGLHGIKRKDKAEVELRLKEATYFSVRDVRTKNELKNVRGTNLAPDSAYIMSDLVDEALFEEKVTGKVKVACSQNYIVFQAAPQKIGVPVSRLINEIRNISNKENMKVILLPIGYASGHDDNVLLAKIHSALPECTDLLYELNVWEIMYVIRNSHMFFGTSLHGIITAMSFGIPHFGLNQGIKKLNSFLQDWSVTPFDQCYSAEKMSSLTSSFNLKNVAALKNKTAFIVDAVKANNDSILKTIVED